MLPDSVLAAPAGIGVTDQQRALRDSGQLNLRAPEMLSTVGAVSGGAGERAPAAAPASAGPKASRPTPLRSLPRRVRPDTRPEEDSGRRPALTGPPLGARR